MREESHKHFIPREAFSGKRFPGYCSGSAYILSANVSKVCSEWIDYWTL